MRGSCQRSLRTSISLSSATSYLRTNIVGRPVAFKDGEGTQGRIWDRFEVAYGLTPAKKRVRVRSIMVGLTA